MSQLARVYSDSDKPEDAVVLFRKIRSADPEILDGMDKYAVSLKRLKAEVELVKLAHDTLAISQTR